MDAHSSKRSPVGQSMEELGCRFCIRSAFLCRDAANQCAMDVSDAFSTCECLRDRHAISLHH